MNDIIISAYRYNDQYKIMRIDVQPDGSGLFSVDMTLIPALFELIEWREWPNCRGAWIYCGWEESDTTVGIMSDSYLPGEVEIEADPPDVTGEDVPF